MAFMWHSGLQDKKVIEVKKFKNSIVFFDLIKYKLKPTYLKKNNKDEKKSDNNKVMKKNYFKFSNFIIFL